MNFYYSQTKLYSGKFTFMVILPFAILVYNIMNYDISTLPDTLYKTDADKFAKNDVEV